MHLEAEQMLAYIVHSIGLGLNGTEGTLSLFCPFQSRKRPFSWIA